MDAEGYTKQPDTGGAESSASVARRKTAMITYNVGVNSEAEQWEAATIAIHKGIDKMTKAGVYILEDAKEWVTHGAKNQMLKSWGDICFSASRATS